MLCRHLRNVYKILTGCNKIRISKRITNTSTGPVDYTIIMTYTRTEL